MKFNIHKKEWEGQLYENGGGKMSLDRSKLKINYKHFSEVKVNVNDLYFKVLSIQGGKSCHTGLCAYKYFL